MPKTVVRLSWTAKQGCRDEVAELTRGWVERQGLDPYVCLSAFTSRNWWMVTSDLVFESEQEALEFWGHIDWGDPGTREVVEKLQSLTESHAREMLYLLT